VSQIKVVGPVPRPELGRTRKPRDRLVDLTGTFEHEAQVVQRFRSRAVLASASSSRARAAASSAAVGSGPPLRLASRDVADQSLTSRAGAEVGPELEDGEAVEGRRGGGSATDDDRRSQTV
jgi:hypothetical protein